jgi:hypothetical protein
MGEHVQDEGQEKYCSRQNELSNPVSQAHLFAISSSFTMKEQREGHQKSS